jgi:hypothetical protein
MFRHHEPLRLPGGLPTDVDAATFREVANEPEEEVSSVASGR